MIHSIKCDNPSFKTIEFKSGFNVILAERKEGSTEKDSRNGLGKSTLIEIIHFCLGGSKGETLKKTQLEGWTFTLDLDIAGKRYSISRNTSKGKGNIVIDGDCSDWALKPSIDKKTGKQIISTDNWNKVLGTLIFGLQAEYDEQKYVPTFRSLISYFIRRNGHVGGFLSPFEQYKKQKEWDIQVNNAFLLELGWEYSSKLQILKDRVTVLAQIKQEAKTGILAHLIGTIGEVEALKIRLEAQVSEEGDQLTNFKVHPQYSKIEEEANELTGKIHELVNLDIDNKRLLEYYEASLKEEIDAKPDSVEKIYREAGLVLPDITKKQITDVLAFHKQVVANRKEFLNSEITRIKNDIARSEQELQNLTGRRTELMQVLQKHGALQEYNSLQTNHQKAIAELKDVNIRLENLKKFETGKSAIVVDQELIYQQANSDLGERKLQKERAVLLFNSNSEALYSEPGTLSIDFEKTGFKFNVKIERSGSHGIGNMKIFCYDLLLAQLWAQKEMNPGVLIHDSILFADVDERQKAHALELAAKESERLGFQYICTMNSDTIPSAAFSKDFNFDKYVRNKFSDATDDGGLLGIRF